MSAAYGVIGWPLGHTLSPVMQQAALDALGIDAVYTALPTPPAQAPRRFRDVRAGRLAGINVTIPHKRAAAAAVDDLAPAAARLGAVNTVSLDGGRLCGDNTDLYGFAEALRRGGFDARGARALVLGAGGAARAALHALADAGAAQVVIANRTPARARGLAADLAAGAAAAAAARDLADPALQRDAARADLLVNTTSVGMAGGPAPDGLPIPAAWMHARLLVYDIVYRPAMTPLLTAARDAGARTLGGLDMLVLQGAASLERWTGRRAPVDVMRRAARAALDAADTAAGG